MLSYDVKKRFLVLHTLSSIIGIVGWVVVALSVILGGYSLINAPGAAEAASVLGIGSDRTPGERAAAGLTASLLVVQMIGGATVGLLVVALAQSIRLGLAIEENTRASREILANGRPGNPA